MANVLGSMIKNGVFMSNQWALTVMVINLSPESKTKALQIADQTGIQAETWLLDDTHKAENIGQFELSGPITFPPQSITLYLVQE